MKFLVVDLDNDAKKQIESKGLFCYDLRESDDGDTIATIEKRVVVNRVGSIVTDEKIEFKKSPYDFIDYTDFCSDNEQVDKIEELFSSKNGFIPHNKISLRQQLNIIKGEMKIQKEWKKQTKGRDIWK